MLWIGCWENNLKEGINMIKFTDFIKSFTEGKNSKIKFKFHMSTDLEMKRENLVDLMDMII